MNKKTKTFISVAVICCAILMLSVIGMGFTLAKYVKTSNRDAEEASVAKFGVVMTWSGDAFAKDYTVDDTSSLDATKLSVKSSAEGDKIAPGTTGTITLTVSGSSETAFNLKIDLTEAYSNNWKTASDGTEYHPITLSAATTIDGANIKTGSTDELEIVNVDGKKTINVKNFEAGETISGAITITWNWAFESGNDTADTYMSTLDATYSLAASAIATQID